MFMLFAVKSAKQRREIFTFELLPTTQAHCSNSFILSQYMKTIPAKQTKGHFAH